MAKRVLSLPYYGGKSPTRGLGLWIASLVPYNKHDVYLEAFAGMAGVLLSRPPCKQEILNDADGHLVNWWLMVRDKPKELGHLLDNTPKSRELYFQYYDALTKGHGFKDNPLERAMAYTVCIEQGLVHGMGHRRWTPRSYYKTGKKRIKALADRIRQVELENRDAAEFIKRYAKYEDVVLYMDPPYHSTKHTDLYGRSDFDKEAVTEAVLRYKGFVAISGYENEWDHLGWNRYEKAVRTQLVARTKKAKDRTEVLWTNKKARGTPKKDLFG